MVYMLPVATLPYNLTLQNLSVQIVSISVVTDYVFTGPPRQKSTKAKTKIHLIQPCFWRC